MARPIVVRPLTSLGAALEKCREAQNMTRSAAINRAGSSRVQWSRMLHEYRDFEPGPVVRAASAVGLDPTEALRLIGYAVVPDETPRVVTTSELLQLQLAG